MSKRCEWREGEKAGDERERQRQSEMDLEKEGD